MLEINKFGIKPGVYKDAESDSMYVLMTIITHKPPVPFTIISEHLDEPMAVFRYLNTLTEMHVYSEKLSEFKKRIGYDKNTENINP